MEIKFNLRSNNTFIAKTKYSALVDMLNYYKARSEYGYKLGIGHLYICEDANDNEYAVLYVAEKHNKKRGKNNSYWKVDAYVIPMGILHSAKQHPRHFEYKIRCDLETPFTPKPTIH